MLCSRLENVRRNTRIEQAESSDESDDEFGPLSHNQSFAAKNG